MLAEVAGETQGLIERNEGLLGAMPNFSSTVASLDRAQRFTGVVKRITFQYGFIQTDSLGDVHMNRSSLVRPSTWQDLGEGQKGGVWGDIRRKDPSRCRT